MKARELVETAAEAFYAELESEFHEEYGIDSDDTREGMLAALKAIGLLDARKAKAIRKAWKRDEERELKHPEVPWQEKFPVFSSEVIDSVFRSSGLNKILRSSGEKNA